MRRTGKVHERKQIWQSVVTTLAAVVVFVTTYALIIPAITWEKTLICELEEHVHTDFCYNSKGELVCGKEEHKHIDACFDAPKAPEPTYYCKKTEHTHTEDCYFADGTLRCTIQEHVHTSSCLRAPLKLLAAPTPDPYLPFYDADPDTSDLLSQFVIGDSSVYSTAVKNDGKVLADKSVFAIDPTNKKKFEVVLSALGQSYVRDISEEEMIHPDIVFVVDISSSMNTGDGLDIDPSTAGNQTRFAAVKDCLNYAIGEMLKADPKSRVGIVAYSETVMDGTVTAGTYYSSHGTAYAYGGTGLYLPLDEYKPLSDNTYVEITEIGSGSENDRQYIGINTALQNKSGTYMNAYPTKALHGTNTQAGLLGALRMFEGVSDKEKREPVLILITDGEPRSANQNVDGTNANSSTGYLNGSSGEKKSDIFQKSWHEAGYWTVRTAMDVKKQVTKMYQDVNTDSENDMFFYTMGPGVTTQYGRTLLDPSEDNLAICRASTNGSESYNEKYLYEALINGQSAVTSTDDYQHHVKNALPALTAEERQYSDFADWSLTGNLTPQELQDGMAVIIANMRKIPRPIITHNPESHYDIIDTDSLLTFIDTLGKGMELTGTPQITYGEGSDQVSFDAALKSSGTLKSDDRYTSEFAGQPYKLYHFVGQIKEKSTSKILDLSTILLYEIKADDGSTVMIWQFPDEILPIIYHDAGTDSVSTADDKFIASDPLRLHMNVQPVGGKTEPGETYYSNSISEPTVCIYTIAEDNPYYNTVSGTAESPVYTPKDLSSTTKKTKNKTGTLPNSSDYAQDGLKMEVLLENNGKLFTPLRLWVKKTWDDTESHSEGITVYLLKDGVKTGKSVTLNSSNNWVAEFDVNLAKYDAGGKQIVYSVLEDPVPDGYTVTGENGTPHWIDLSEWKTVTTMAADQKYRIHFGSDTSADVLMDSSDSIAVGSPSTNTTTKSEQWKVVNDSGTLRLQNVQSGNYLRIGSSGNLRYTNSNDTAFELDASSTDRKIKLTKSYYVRYLNVSGTTVSVASDRSGGTAVTIEQLFFEGAEPVYGFELVNTPMKLTFSAEKIWESGTSPTEITLQVYKKTSGGVTPVEGSAGILKLNASGDWKGTYTLSGSDIDPSASYYVAETTTGYFTTVYSSATEDITYGGKTFKAVPLDKAHATSVTVTNKTLTVPLPATGGIGTDKIVMIGSCLVAVPLIYALYVLNQRRKRERRRAE